MPTCKRCRRLVTGPRYRPTCDRCARDIRPPPPNIRARSSVCDVPAVEYLNRVIRKPIADPTIQPRPTYPQHEQIVAEWPSVLNCIERRQSGLRRCRLCNELAIAQK